MVATVAAAGLVLSGCSVAEGLFSGSTEETEDATAAEEQAPAFQAEPGIAGTTTQPVEVSFTPVEESMQNRLLAPAVDLRITEVAQTQTLSAAVYEDLTGEEAVIEAESMDEEDEPVETVAPAEGQVFLIANYASDDPKWEPRGNEPDSEASILIAGNEIAEAFSTDDGTMQRGTIVANVPAEASPDSAVLEVETDEAFQSLSLLDGSRVSSDVEHIYGVTGSTVEVVSAEEFEETFKTWVGDDARMAGSVVGGFLTPWMDSSDDGQGWAGTDQVYLAVDVDWAEIDASTADRSSIYLQLPDETTVRPDNSPVDSNFEDDAVFRIPVDTEDVTVVIEPEVEVIGGTSSNVDDWQPVEAELAIHAA